MSRRIQAPKTYHGQGSGRPKHHCPGCGTPTRYASCRACYDPKTRERSGRCRPETARAIVAILLEDAGVWP